MHTPDHELPSRFRSKGQLLKCFSIEINPYHTNLIIWPIYHHSKLFTTCASKISGPLIKFQCNCLHTVNATMDHQAKALQVSHGQTPYEAQPFQPHIIFVLKTPALFHAESPCPPFTTFSPDDKKLSLYCGHIHPRSATITKFKVCFLWFSANVTVWPLEVGWGLRDTVFCLMAICTDT